MQLIENRQFDEERALYGLQGAKVKNCKFDGPADGESAFKECGDIIVEDSYFNLRYPFWHVNKGVIIKSINDEGERRNDRKLPGSSLV